MGLHQWPRSWGNIALAQAGHHLSEAVVLFDWSATEDDAQTEYYRWISVEMKTTMEIWTLKLVAEWYQCFTA